MDDRTKRVVVVTGASAGVGRATVRALARRGDALALVARGHEGLEATRREVEALGARALVLPADVADADAVEAVADAVERELGPIDVWINCAMVSVFSPVSQMRAEEYRRVTEVTYLGYVHGTLAALRRMQPRGRGTIVQVGSLLGYRSIPLQSAYCAAKHAVVGFTESLRCELIHEKSGVRLTIVDLPAVDTPQFGWTRSHLRTKLQPLPPIFSPEVAARAIVWATDHPERRTLAVGFSTFKGRILQKLAPGLVDRYLARKGYSGQLTAEPDDPRRPDNLFAPVEGDRGAHGRFVAREQKSSGWLWLSTHRRLLGALSALGAALAWAGRKRLSRAAPE